MRTLFTLIFISTFCFQSAGQQNHFSSLRLTTHFDFGLKAPGLDDAGFGLQADVLAFARNRLHLLTSVHVDRLLGDKSYYIEPNAGRINKPGMLYGLQAGPEYLLVPHVAVSVQYGVFWHSIRETSFNADDGYRVALALLPGKNKSFVVKLSRTFIPTSRINIRYYTFGVGCTIF